MSLALCDLTENRLVEPEGFQFGHHELPATIVGWNGLVDVEFHSEPFTLQHAPRGPRVRGEGLFRNTFGRDVPELLQSHVDEILNRDFVRMLHFVHHRQRRMQDAANDEQQHAGHEQTKPHTVGRGGSESHQGKHRKHQQGYQQHARTLVVKGHRVGGVANKGSALWIIAGRLKPRRIGWPHPLVSENTRPSIGLEFVRGAVHAQRVIPDGEGAPTIGHAKRCTVVVHHHFRRW